MQLNSTYLISIPAINISYICNAVGIWHAIQRHHVMAIACSRSSVKSSWSFPAKYVLLSCAQCCLSFVVYSIPQSCREDLLHCYILHKASNVIVQEHENRHIPEKTVQRVAREIIHDCNLHDTSRHEKRFRRFGFLQKP